MKKPVLPDTSGQVDDQILETDIMRFVAIIGMVFWILFALVKTIPSSETGPPVLEDIPPVVSAMPERPLSRPEPVNGPVNMAAAEPLAPVADNQPPAPVLLPKPAPPPLPQAAPIPAPDHVFREEGRVTVNTVEPMAALPAVALPSSGLRLQFASRGDLLALLGEQRIQLFGRARTAGFDLCFAGERAGEGVVFRGVKDLPETLWEIRSGGDHAYFLELLAAKFPEIRAFAERWIYVAFIDGELGRRVDRAFDEATAAGRDGILSVTRGGDVVFDEYRITGAGRE